MVRFVCLAAHLNIVAIVSMPLQAAAGSDLIKGVDCIPRGITVVNLWVPPLGIMLAELGKVC